MTPQQVIQHFQGLNGTADALGITAQAVGRWKTANAVPALRQLQIRDKTLGKLRPSSAARKELNL